MAKTRRLDIVISGEDKSAGKTFKNVGQDADRLGDELKKSGEKAGKAFGKGVGDGVDERGFSEKMRGIGEKVSGAFKTALVGGGLAAAALFTQGVMDHLDKEFALDKLEAQLGGGEWGEMAGRIAGDLYVEAFGDSVGEVGQTVRDVLQGGLLAEDADEETIKNLTRQVLTFSDVLDQDANMAVQALTSILRSGLAKDGTEALDILTRGIQQGGDKAGDLLETFQEYSTMFRDVGIDADDAMGLMVQGLRNGARDADKVADALKEFAIRAQDGSELTADGFEKIGLNAEEMGRMVAGGGQGARDALDQVLDGLRLIEDPVERNAAAVALFGAQAEDLGDALFSLDLDTAAQGLGDVAGSTDDLASAYDNAKTKIEEFKRQAMEKLTTFIAEEVIPRLESFSEWVQDNEDKVKIFGAVILGFVGVALAAYIASMITAAIATIAATWPILAVIALIALLAAGVWYAYQNWGWFRDALAHVIVYANIMRNVIQGVAGWVWNLVSAVWAAVGALIEFGRRFDIVNRLKPGTNSGGGLIPNVGDFIGGLARRAGGGPVAAGEAYWVGDRFGINSPSAELFIPDTSGMIVPGDMTSNMVAAASGGGNRYVGTAVLELDGRELGAAMIDFSADYQATNGRAPFGR